MTRQLVSGRDDANMWEAGSGGVDGLGNSEIDVADWQVVVCLMPDHTCHERVRVRLQYRDMKADGTRLCSSFRMHLLYSRFRP
jgi:hypothetical protein